MPPLTWLVTGCSSGFGSQFVQSITARGDNCIATARKVERLRHLEGTGARFMQLDVTAGEEVLEGKVKEALAVWGRVDVLVNNAGGLEVGVLEERSCDDFLRMFNTVVFGSVNLTRAILPHFRERRSGVVVYMGSMWGWEGSAGNSMYCGVKFALEGIVESLSAETAHLSIRHLLVEPGFFRTAVLSHENLSLPSAHLPDYASVTSSLESALRSANGKQPGDPVRGVDVIVDVVKQEGVAEGKGWPDRLPLGSDAVACLRGKCERTLRLLEEWEGVIVKSDFPAGE